MYYLDTSALAKLVITEAESQALRDFLANLDPDDLVTSALTRTELLRVAYRYGNGSPDAARNLLEKVSTLAMTRSLLDAAGSVGPPSLRTLDAIHLASAHKLGSGLSAVVAYDTRLLDAAISLGLPTLVPT